MVNTSLLLLLQIAIMRWSGENTRKIISSNFIELIVYADFIFQLMTW